MNVTFFRYRTKWAFGFSDWIHDYVCGSCSIENLEEYVSELCFKEENLDHYRGVVVEMLENPPKDWLTAQIVKLRIEAESKYQMANLLEQYQKS